MNTLRAGKGIFQMKDGTVYMGYFEDDLPHGLGIIHYANGDKFEG